MAREEARARVIEDSDTLTNLKVNTDQSLDSRIKDSSGNSITIGQKVSNSSVPVVVSSDQPAIPVTTTPSTPANTTAVVNSGNTLVAKLGGTGTTTYLIPNGETVTLTVFRFGGYLPSNTASPLNAKCVLYYRPNGTGNTTGQVEIYDLYLQHTAIAIENFAEGEVQYTGDGTAVFEMVVTNWSQNQAEMFRQIRGYY